MYPRILDLPERSFSLFGPRVRKVGKVTVLPYRMAIEMAREGSFVAAP